MDLRGYVEITELDRRLLVQAVYAASRPQGLGFLHFREGALDKGTVDAVLAAADKYRNGGLDLDYVHGRACKFRVKVSDNRHYVAINWYDHSPEQLKEMLRGLKLPDAEARFAEAERGEADRQVEYEEENRRARG